MNTLRSGHLMGYLCFSKKKKDTSIVCMPDGTERSGKYPSSLDMIIVTHTSFLMSS
ncbi:hypothetical protein [Paenibacillus sp. FSL K6-2859]|uniref:hypothetical protein n=1 Tax=Paenibacillus sp. FSL K6-2859 TaxID=2921482 RepID=UPI0030F6B1D4